MKRREHGEGGESDGGMIGLNKDRKKRSEIGREKQKGEIRENGRWREREIG